MSKEKICGDCIHLEVCEDIDDGIQMCYTGYKGCEHFKPKSRYIELPCEIGQTIYDASEIVSGTYAPEVYELRGNEITIEKERNGKIVFVYDGLYVYPDEIGKTFFLTEDDMKKALKGGADK